MIGLSKRARKRYHKVDPDFPAQAKCHMRYIDERHPDGDEAVLKARGLKPCQNCWPWGPDGQSTRRLAKRGQS